MIASRQAGAILAPMSTAPPVQTVLVIEDNPELREILDSILRSAGFEVITAADGHSGLNAAIDHQPELLILDVGLPGRSGLHVAADLRARGFRAPVLMLTARDTVPDKVLGLNAGADDYLAKPFDQAELVARVRALLRRATIRAEDSLIRVADLTIDLMTREASRGGRRLALTRTQYGVLEYLARNAGRPVTRDMIIEHVWRVRSAEPSPTIVDVYVNYLRDKIDAGSTPKLIHTIRGVGYMLGNPPDPVD